MKPYPDAQILDWLESKMPQPFLRMHLSDARDMGYKTGFISFGVEDSPTGKGNSVREAISAAMKAAKVKRLPELKPFDHSHEAIPLGSLDGQKIEPGTWVVVRARANEFGRKSTDTGYSLEVPPVGTWCQCCRWNKPVGDTTGDIVGTGKTMQFTQKHLDRINER